tara:strand:- start:52 stop:585 length:534 start_codon:yes stop_codon:yes gene_type:complete
MAEETKTAKIPEGVRVETPKVNEIKQLPIPEFSLDPSLPIISNPHYTNNKRTELACVLLRPDGMATQEKGIPTDEKHPLYRDIKKQFSEDEIRHNTQRQMQVQNALQAAAKADEDNRAREDKRSRLWSTKSTFLDLEQVRNTEFKVLKRKLRSAQTPEEAQAFGIAIIIKEAEKDGN